MERLYFAEFARNVFQEPPSLSHIVTNAKELFVREYTVISHSEEGQGMENV
jgi:hypothetical protein